ncbi:hypothetical protein GCM10022255_112590 [Dactylosporangium darangshiense]|uniref:Integrase catalytic domain-containing protein n=2 Tax=Dactylosporangium darangshiense TaxID=579108 RepID=A0ABP8DV61_9ACTN
MGRVGSCFDNAVAEATFSTIKVEYVHRHQSRSRTEARLKIATWITDLSGYAGDPWLSPVGLTGPGSLRPVRGGCGLRSVSGAFVGRRW